MYVQFFWATVLGSNFFQAKTSKKVNTPDVGQTLVKHTSVYESMTEIDS